MLIKNDFEVAQPVEKVWEFFGDIPQVATCLPGAELTEDLGGEKYKGRVAVRMGPVRLQFAGTAEIAERDDAAKRLVLNAAGAEEKGRGQASMVVTATLVRSGRGTKVNVAQDLQLSGAAAQYGRGMISDVTSVLMRDFAATMQDRIERVERGESAEQIAASGTSSASGLALGHAGRGHGAEPGLPPFLRPLPRPRAEKEPVMVLWWIGNVVLLVVVLPVVIFLLNRVLAALERIRGGRRPDPGRRRRARRRTAGRPRGPGPDRRHGPRGRRWAPSGTPVPSRNFSVKERANASSGLDDHHRRGADHRGHRDRPAAGDLPPAGHPGHARGDHRRGAGRRRSSPAPVPPRLTSVNASLKPVRDFCETV